MNLGRVSAHARACLRARARCWWVGGCRRALFSFQFDRSCRVRTFSPALLAAGAGRGRSFPIAHIFVHCSEWKAGDLKRRKRGKGGWEDRGKTGGGAAKEGGREEEGGQKREEERLGTAPPPAGSGCTMRQWTARKVSGKVDITALMNFAMLGGGTWRSRDAPHKSAGPAAPELVR